MPKNGISKKFQQLLYSFNTSDRYADYNSNSSSGKKGLFSDKDPDSRLTSPILGSSYQSNSLLSGEFDIHNEGVSETLLAWRHIELWLNKNFSELHETLSPPVTKNDITKLEQDLGVELPPSVVSSIRIHDGQDFSGSFRDYSGLIYGLELMSLDKIVQMTGLWRKVANRYNQISRKRLGANVDVGLKSPEMVHSNSSNNVKNGSGISVNSSSNIKATKYVPLNTDADLEPIKKITSSSEVLSTAVGVDLGMESFNAAKFANLGPKAAQPRDSMSKQASVPPHAVHPVYAHHDWIPLLTDNAGNHVAVDLSPGPAGKYGQVILFGRDFDTKYVVASNWGEFLLQFAKSLENGEFVIRSESLVDDIMDTDGELCYYDKYRKQERNYLDVLKDIAVQEMVKQQKSPQKPASASSQDTASSPVEHNTDYTYDELLGTSDLAQDFSFYEKPNTLSDDTTTVVTSSGVSISASASRTSSGELDDTKLTKALETEMAGLAVDGAGDKFENVAI